MNTMSHASQIKINARTLLSQAALRERVESLLCSDRRLRRSFVPGKEAFGFRVQGIEQSSSIRFTVRRLTATIKRVELTFHKKDAKLAGRLLDLLMPDVVDELTLSIFRRAHADKSHPAIVAWPEELLAA